MPYSNNSRKKLISPLTENLFYNENFSANANPVVPLPIETEDLEFILTEDDDVLFTEGDL